MDGVGAGTVGEGRKQQSLLKYIYFSLSKRTLNNDIQSSVDRGATERGRAGVLSSLRCCYSTECEDTGHLLPTNDGVSWGRSYSGPFPLEVWSTSYSSRQSDRAGESDKVSSHNEGGGRVGEGDHQGIYM